MYDDSFDPEALARIPLNRINLDSYVTEPNDLHHTGFLTQGIV